MKRIVWRIKIQECLQEPVDMGDQTQILSPSNQSDPLQMIVHRYREVITGRGVFSRQHNIPKYLGGGKVAANICLLPGQ